MPTKVVPQPVQIHVRARHLRPGDYYPGLGIVARYFQGTEPEGNTLYVKVWFNHVGKEGNRASFHPDSLLEVWR